MSFNRPKIGSFIFSGHAPASPPHTPPTSNPDIAEPPPPPTPNRKADLLNLAEIQVRPVDWLWQDRLASGTLALLSGGPGVGKTYLTLAIAAALTRGITPFSGEPREPSTVLYAATENSASEIMRPRFEKLLGDLSRFFLLRGVDAAPSTLSLRDTSILEDALQRTQARLLIVDPMQSYCGASAQLQRSNHITPIFENLTRLAEKHHCCILLVRHLSKRGSGGSTELSSAVRTEFLAGSSPDAPSLPALVHVKSNLGPLSSALGYKIDQAGHFTWTGPSNLTPQELLAGRPTGAGTPQRRFVGDWLCRQLRAGSLSQYKIEMAAQRDGISIPTLRRAKFDLGVLSVKDGINGPWSWSLPKEAAH